MDPVEPELPFVWRPAGGRAGTDAIARGAAHRWGLAEPELVAMGMNAVYRAGGAVIRVGAVNGRPEAAAELAVTLAAAGVRVPAPLPLAPSLSDGELVATAWEYVASTGAPIDWVAVGEMVSRVHRLAPERVPDGYPLPWCGSFPWWQFDDLLDDMGDDLVELDAAAIDGLLAAIERAGDWASSAPQRVVCHGDVHWDNVLMSDDGPVLLDWDLLCVGPVAWDHAPMLRYAEPWGGDERAYERYAAGLGTDLRGDPLAETLANLRLVAATLLRVRSGRHDPAAREEARRRLRYWRGDADAPPWISWR